MLSNEFRAQVILLVYAQKCQAINNHNCFCMTNTHISSHQYLAWQIQEKYHSYNSM